MAEDTTDEYELLPHKEIEELKEELAKLKEFEIAPSKKLTASASAQKSVSTRTYMCAVAALMYLAHAIAGKPSSALSSTVSRIVDAQEEVLDRHAALTPACLEFFAVRAT